MPLEYRLGRASRSTRPCATRSASSTSATSARLMVAGPGAVGVRQRLLSNDLGRIAPGQAQYTLCCDEATGGVVDDLIAYLPRRRPRAPRAQRRQHRRGRAPAARPRHPRASRSTTTTAPTPCWRCRARSPTRCSTRSACPAATTTCPSSRRRSTARRRGLPHRLHRRARLRADRRATTSPSRCGTRCSTAGEPFGIAAVRPRRARHAAHRDGLPAARPGHHPRRHAQPGPARLGGRLEEGRLLGPGRRWWPRRRPGRRGGCAGWSPTERGIPRPGMRSASPPTCCSARSRPARSPRP